MSTTQTNPTRWQAMAGTKSPAELWAELQGAKRGFIIAAITAFMASAFFVVKYFVGGEMNPVLWSVDQYLNAVLGLGITGAITYFQYKLYSSGNGKATMTTIIAVCIAVFFGMFSEISQSLEREDSTVRYRSENSAVFKATVGAIQSATSAPVFVSPALGDAQAAAAKARVEIAACSRHASKGQTRVDKCLLVERGNLAQAEARVQSAQAASSASAQSNQQTALALADKAKAMEYDEEQHYGMIRLIRETFGVSPLVAAFIFSVIVIGTFEYAFHFMGGYKNDLETALRALGYDTAKHKELPPEPLKRAAPPIRKESSNAYAPEFAVGFSPSPIQAAFNQNRQAGHPAPAAAAVGSWLNDKLAPADSQSTYQAGLASHGVLSPADPALSASDDKATIDRIIQRGLGAKEHQFSMPLPGANPPCNTHGSRVIHTADSGANSPCNIHSSRVIHTAESVDHSPCNIHSSRVIHTADSDAMLKRYALADSAETGQVVGCPTCSADFLKTVWNKRFCQPACKDAFHNAMQPARLEALKAKRIKAKKKKRAAA